MNYIQYMQNPAGPLEQVNAHFAQDFTTRFLSDTTTTSNQRKQREKRLTNPAKIEMKKLHKGITGYYNPLNNKIVISETAGKDTDNTLIHEGNHSLYHKKRLLTKANKELLNLAYGSTRSPEVRGSNKVIEKAAFNTELRYEIFKILQDQLNRVPNMEEVNNFINKMQDSDIQQLMEQIGSYGNDYKNTFDADSVKEALINIAQNSNSNFDGLAYAKSGAKIHIKKKNIGSFTRYCNGKVTEECIRKGKNSSNSTTRKRANFASNARKWKHEEGGNINYLNYFN